MKQWENVDSLPRAPLGYVTVPDGFEVIGRQAIPHLWVPEVRTQPRSMDASVRELRKAVMQVCHRLLANGWVIAHATDGKGGMMPLPRWIWDCEEQTAIRRLSACAIMFTPDLIKRAGGGMWDVFHVHLKALRHGAGFGIVIVADDGVFREGRNAANVPVLSRLRVRRSPCQCLHDRYAAIGSEVDETHRASIQLRMSAGR